MTNNTIQYYLSLITPQYQNSPKFLNWFERLLRTSQGIVDLLTIFDDEFDLDTAVGDQLDMLGEILGQSRNLEFQPSYGISPILEDEMYRLLLKAKVIRNHWDGQAAYLIDRWADLFPEGKILIVDNQDMTISVTLEGAFSLPGISNSGLLIPELIDNGLIVPRPEGVLMNVYVGELPFFGFDLDDANIAGFDKGKWA
jgi:hypothetical protein